ncbi:hypothetical protein L2Z47_03950 [Acinetobacter baumannii]|uniref:hypothetical protein n=1 Tax=Acinetobacter baumannii TaxID=470 RepID=UPI000CE35C23|nr:hypothetical protein [Acinetobacter baumannii]EKW4079200.1 hypothetical protein [Acinetobacter baumannii]MBU0403821.1 hypothetical protein [Acinetobacter baumannii]PPC17006.1 hypothetical protein AbaHC9436_15905 [Acinetobacter baumannii]UMN02944.1 hypothetical protein L2Z47_03950 [Acinetobacter baumannii]HAV3045209.1 hypothetical protein [Acinetobacter baumannii]
MKPLHALRGLAKAHKAQATVNEFFKEVDQHFSSLGAHEIGITYCAGDGFLITDGRSKGDNYEATTEVMEKLFSLKTANEVYAFIDTLECSL